MLRTLDHVVIGVRDLEGATERYSTILGRRASWRGSHPRFGTANTLFRLENTYLELLAPAGEAPVARMLEERLRRDGEGPIALAFGTEDAAGCAASFRERGLGASDPSEGRGREQETGAERHWHNVLLPDSDTRGVQIFAIEHHSPADALPVAQPIAPAPSLVTGVDHVVIMTGDAEGARALYGEKLGIRLALDRVFESRGLRLLFFRIGGITLEIAAQLDAPAETEAQDRLWGLAYRVPSVAAARTRLAEVGLEVSETRRGQKEGTSVCTVRSGTHGVATLLIGPAEPHKAEAP